ncbi:hypothetical protein [Deinococcus sp. RL]|uniref:hypothetical protein n=1 Tax=Deinococcus sp. RL TaxID=1489678 RepID=UPI000A7FBFD3|nr:hypothetical protein [Deinococcus sp. RL]
MDAILVARELEMALLAKLLESRFVNASSNLTLPAAALLHLLRGYLGPHLTLSDLQRAVAFSPVLTWTPYAREVLVGDIRSADGVRLNVRRWNPYAADRRPFEAKLRAHAERPRPPLAATSYQGGALGTREVHFEVRNEGYGTAADVQVTGVSTPDWVEARHEANHIFLAARPQQAGVYRGQVTVWTTANPLVFEVSARSADFVVPTGAEVVLNDLLGDHPDLDRPASEALLEQQLLRLQFERLPGGLFIRRGLHSVPSRTQEWWITETDLAAGSVPASGYPEHFLLYLDVDGQVDRFPPLRVTAQHGQLGGEFAELFDLLDVQAGQKLSLLPFRGGFKTALSPTEPWRAATGHTYWLQGPRQDVLAQPEVLEFLLRRCDDRNITVNLLLCGEGELPPDLVRQHRAGRLSIRWTSAALPYRLLVCGEHSAGYVPPYGPRQGPVTVPQTLWEAATPLQGRDYREQAWQRGRNGEGTSEGGLLDLDLSVAMMRLARAIAAAPAPTSSVTFTPRQRQTLLEELPRRAREYGVDRRPVVAAPHLGVIGLSAEQVNAGANGYRVTAGGYLVRRPQDVGGLRECARYLGGLYGGVIHHSQLRKLVEAFTGYRIEPASFVIASLDVMGWAGNGYRRPRQAWEPQRRELTLFVAEALQHFGTRDTALDWLRRNVAATDEQLARALGKAEVLSLRWQSLLAAPPPASTSSTAVQSRKEQQAAPPPVRSPRPPLQFAPLTSLQDSLPDPRLAPMASVRDAVTRLVRAEGPITESWLVRRYAQQAKLNPAQVRRAVLEGASLAVQAGDLHRTVHPCGATDFVAPDQRPSLRERGTRQPEDIPLSEWCLLLESLGLQAAQCDEDKAFAEAARAYRFGTAARSARSVISLAWQAVQRGGPPQALTPEVG